MYNEQIAQTLSNYIKYMKFDDVEKHEFLNELCDTINRIYYPVFFRYPQKINGYNVEGAFYIGNDGSTDYWDEYNNKVLATLFFSSDSHQFSVSHYYFRPYTDSFPSNLNALDCVELTYKTPDIPNPYRIPLDSIRDLPFYFIDIDFDGKEELLLSNPGNGQKTICTYTALEYPFDKEINPFKGYTWNCLDEWTEFDYENKVVISSLWGGYDGCEKWYFKYEGDKLKPFLKEEYTHWFDSIKVSTPIQL